MFYKPSAIADPALPPGTGATTPYGDVRYSSQGPQAEQDLVRFHEQVHQALSPRLRLFRQVRADLSQHMYNRSILLRYIEEAAAETYAQLRVNGFSGAMDGLRFPTSSPTYSITFVAVGRSVRGLAVGTITVAGTMYVVYVSAEQAGH